MHHVHALALRRTALVGTGLGLTIASHGAAVGGLRVTAIAPVLWGTILLASFMCGGRGRFRPRGWVTTFAGVAAVQLVAHVLLLWAPWLLGLVVHHDAAALEPRALLVHAAGAVVLTAILRGADRLLAAALAVVRLITGHARWGTPTPDGERLPADRATVRSRVRPRADGARGPPPRPAVAAS